MRLLYFVAGGIAVILFALAWPALFGWGATAFVPGSELAGGLGLIAGAIVAAFVAWWAAKKGANKWPR